MQPHPIIEGTTMAENISSQKPLRLTETVKGAG